jgi:guanylate kinase
MKNLKVFIINGSGGVGKDEIVRQVSSCITSYRFL